MPSTLPECWRRLVTLPERHASADMTGNISRLFPECLRRLVTLLELQASAGHKYVASTSSGCLTHYLSAGHDW